MAADGVAAVESFLAARAAGTPYDRVLMDLHMPGMDGIEATRRIRAIEAEQEAPRSPILALTANASAEDRDACLTAGMDGFLVKPLDRERLSAALAGGAAALARFRSDAVADPSTRALPHSRRSATSSTSWLSPFLRIRSARGRVGRIFSRRLTRLMRFQIEVAVAIASASDNCA